MKHVFLVHSPITYLTSVSIIKKLNVSKQNALIIFFDFEEITQTGIYISTSVNVYYNNQHFFKKLVNYFTQFNLINRFDNLVSKNINDEKFIAYIPVLTFAAKALITNKNCVAFNFIEEGLAHYYKEETLSGLSIINSKDPWRSSIVKNTGIVLKEMYSVLRGYNFKLQSLPFSYSCYTAFVNVNYYGLSKDSFPLVTPSKKIVLSFNQSNFNCIKNDYPVDISNSFIWIGDGGVSQHGFNKKIYIDAIENGFIKTLLINNSKKVFLKYHRNESGTLREEIKGLFEKNAIAFEVIPDAVIMELLLFKATNVVLVGIYSSLLYYAIIMGHQAFSIYKFVESEYKSIIANRDFSFYWDKVQLIEFQETMHLN